MQRQLDNAQKAEAAAWPPHHGVQQGKVPGGGVGDAADSRCLAIDCTRFIGLIVAVHVVVASEGITNMG